MGEPELGMKPDDDLDRIDNAIQGALNPGERYLLILLTPTPGPNGGGATRVRTAGTVDGDRYVQILSDVLENVARNRVGTSGRMGVELPALPDRTKVKLFELIDAMVRGSGKALGVSVAAWVDLMLLWSANTAHDVGVNREDYLVAALETIDEEWSTPNAEGRAALRELASKGQG